MQYRYLNSILFYGKKKKKMYDCTVRFFVLIIHNCYYACILL